MTLHKTILIVTVFFIALSNGSAQSKMSPVLSKNIEACLETDFVKVNIRLKKQVNLDSLLHQFNKNHTPSQKRAEITISLLKSTATNSQEILLNFLNKNQTKTKDLKTYWVINMITLKAQPQLVYELMQQNQIESLQTDEHRYYNIEPVSIKPDTKKGLSAAEPGIYAINAPAMWKLGYTGRNRIALGVDTGVKKHHPAIANQFLGKYRPMSQSWYGYNNTTPEDLSFSSYHGTHTIGTVLGLNRNTQDTIGVAFNAYWMASDPIVSSLSDVRPLDVVLQSFEWALNPDGDLNTVDDMPDVITNSWGWDKFYDFSDCIVPEAQAIFAAETAGIGVIFSAGNDGPGASTTGQPANLAPQLLSVFSVGAVNGNSLDYLIADFSSRGPTNCVEQSEDYSRWIKPEIVAPGVNVRSAQGDASYGQLSGTSMAAPHVAGAFLLLKEAFPYLPGSDLLKALYNSAIDLGIEGEDNSYGKGMIDVKAAFDLLSTTYTPVPPIENNYDLALTKITNLPESYTFNKTVIPEIEIVNNGTLDVPGINLAITLNSQTTSQSFNDIIKPGETKLFSLGEMTLLDGVNNLKIATDMVIDAPESDYINNTSYAIIKVPEKVTLPFTETFDTTEFSFTNTKLTLVNPNNDWTWTVDTAGGLPESSYSLRLDFTKMKKRNDEVDQIISPLLIIPETEEVISMQLKYAYARRMVNLFKDSLMILVSTDLGENWNDTLFVRGGENLSTVDKDMGIIRFIPSTEDEWEKLQFDLSKYKGNNILISIKTVNDNGSNLYLDDFKVYEGLYPSSIPNKSAVANLNMNLFPNPATEKLTIVFSQKINSGTLTVINTMGQVVFAKPLSEYSSLIELNINTIEKGFYFISYTSAKFNATQSFIKL